MPQVLSSAIGSSSSAAARPRAARPCRSSISGHIERPSSHGSHDRSRTSRRPRPAEPSTSWAATTARHPGPRSTGQYDGVHIDLVARLPVGLRYPAVTAANGDVFIAGGVSSNGPSSAVYRFDPRTGRVSMLGRLPGASAHAIAIVVGSGIDVLGGSPAVSARIDLATSAVVPAHIRFVDANGAVATGKPSYVLGGDVSGRVVGTIWEIAGALPHKRVAS